MEAVLWHRDGWLVFIDDESVRTNSEVYRTILSAHIKPKSEKPTERRFTPKMGNDPKRNEKATLNHLKAEKWDIVQWPSQSPDPNPIEQLFSC